MKHFFLICAFFATIALFAAEVSFDYFKARSDGSSVVIEWRSNAEKSVKQYDVERSLNGQPYRYILTQQAQGPSVSYRVVDEEAVMKQGNNSDQSKFLANNYSYRLKIIGTNNSITYSEQVNVYHNVSGVRSTWGKIKEIFR
ncbi:MAG: hypothetical protein JNL36_06465 [Candidatus Kapabacteria bacterium]|jgi:hypothetical protein|nr:hypothetical protein [Candidatus Kapabacteria bacterium]